MDDPENTPEWCEMREDILRDAKEMAKVTKPEGKPESLPAEPGCARGHHVAGRQRPLE
jgi:hypothetical protein